MSVLSTNASPLFDADRARRESRIDLVGALILGVLLVVLVVVRLAL